MTCAAARVSSRAVRHGDGQPRLAQERRIVRAIADRDDLLARDAQRLAQPPERIALVRDELEKLQEDGHRRRDVEALSQQRRDLLVEQRDLLQRADHQILAAGGSATASRSLAHLRRLLAKLLEDRQRGMLTVHIDGVERELRDQRLRREATHSLDHVAPVSYPPAARTQSGGVLTSSMMAAPLRQICGPLRPKVASQRAESSAGVCRSPASR